MIITMNYAVAATIGRLPYSILYHGIIVNTRVVKDHSAVNRHKRERERERADCRALTLVNDA